MDAENTGVEFQNQMNFGFDSTDNEVSTMVDQYLTKDPLQLDEDWAAAVDSALFMIANPDHHMSMPSSTTSANLDATHFHGMHYSDANQPHYPNEQLQYEAYQSAPQQYLHTDRGNVQIQYIDPQQQQTYQIVEQVGQNSMALYGNQQGYSQGNSGDYNQTSPVYYVAQTVQNIPLAEPAHPAHLTFTYENYASLPHGASLPRLNTMASHGLQQAAQRTRSASSAGNSPSSQSPVSEEEFVESTTTFPKDGDSCEKSMAREIDRQAKLPLFSPPAAGYMNIKTFAPRRQSKDSVPPKKAKQVKPRRLRKRDPNEPTKPVSAYALFFRDKQATIKGSKPDASFGEVSKIVAHMWDNLEPEKKSNYKKRTEEAKKDYLAQLAHYRASLVSSPNDAPLYIQTSFMSRSPPIHMQNSYNRHPYSHQTQSHLKMHLSASPAMNHSANLVQDPDCLQSSTHMNENGQIYARVMEPDMHHKNNYVNPVHAQFWESQGKADDDGIVAHCKDEFPHEWLTQQLQPSSTAKVVI